MICWATSRNGLRDSYDARFYTSSLLPTRSSGRQYRLGLAGEGAGGEFARSCRPAVRDSDQEWVSLSYLGFRAPIPGMSRMGDARHFRGHYTQFDWSSEEIVVAHIIRSVTLLSHLFRWPLLIVGERAPPPMWC